MNNKEIVNEYLEKLVKENKITDFDFGVYKDICNVPFIVTNENCKIYLVKVFDFNAKFKSMSIYEKENYIEIIDNTIKMVEDFKDYNYQSYYDLKDIEDYIDLNDRLKKENMKLDTILKLYTKIFMSNKYLNSNMILNDIRMGILLCKRNLKNEKFYLYNSSFINGCINADTLNFINKESVILNMLDEE